MSSPPSSWVNIFDLLNSALARGDYWLWHAVRSRIGTLALALWHAGALARSHIGSGALRLYLPDSFASFLITCGIYVSIKHVYMSKMYIRAAIMSRAFVENWLRLCVGEKPPSQTATPIQKHGMIARVILQVSIWL